MNILYIFIEMWVICIVICICSTGGMCNLTILKVEKNRLRRLPISIGRQDKCVV